MLFASWSYWSVALETTIRIMGSENYWCDNTPQRTYLFNKRTQNSTTKAKENQIFKYSLWSCLMEDYHIICNIFGKRALKELW